MQTKHLCVLIHIWTKGEVGAPWNRFKPSNNIFLLTDPRRCFFCGSFMLFLSCFWYVFERVCLLMPCGHLLGKGWPLSSLLWCLIVKLPLSHWYPGSGAVLDCIDSWSLSSFKLLYSLNPYLMMLYMKLITFGHLTLEIYLFGNVKGWRTNGWGTSDHCHTNIWLRWAKKAT